MRDYIILPESEQPPVVEWVEADGLFIKQLFIAKEGTIIPQHAHVFDHVSLVAVGAIRVWKDDVLAGDVVAPTPVFIAAGVKHKFMALEPNTLIFCCHNLKGEAAVKILAEHDLLLEG